MPTILVTGATGGIGEQTSLYLLSQPSTKVIGVARRAAPSSISSNSNYTHIQGDLTEASTISKITEVVGSKLDGAIFNAGIMDSLTRLEHTDLNVFRKVFDVNFFSIIELTRALVPALRASHGRAIYVSSLASEQPLPTTTAYGTSKAALNLMVATLATEEPDITALSIEPGVVDTPMLAHFRDSGSDDKSLEGIFEEFKKNLTNPKLIGELFGRTILTAKHDLSGKYLHHDDPVLH